MWFLPSRSRPANVKRFFAAALATGMITPGVLRVDVDDAHNYADVLLPAGWAMHVGQRMTLGDMTNEFYALNPDAEWYGLLGDDVVPRTNNWDSTLVAAAMTHGMAYPDDWHQAPALACHMALRGDFVRKVGWLALPGLDRLYIDTALTTLARRQSKICYCSEVVLEHCHFSNGKAIKDAIYNKPRAASDRAIFDRWVCREEAHA